MPGATQSKEAPSLLAAVPVPRRAPTLSYSARADRVAIYRSTLRIKR